MKKSILMTSLIVGAALVSQPALADIKVRVGGGTSTYELSGDWLKGKSTYSPTTLGITFSSDASTNGAYLDIGYSGGTGSHDVFAGYTGGTTSDPFKRQDFALTGGAVFLNPNNGIAGNVYVGLKTGKTTLGSPLGVHYVGAATVSRETTLTTSGVVFGGGASFPIAGGRAGSAGVNVGLGIMGNKWATDNGLSATANYAVGGSIGANYTFPFSQNFGVTADYKYQSYSYDFSSSTQSQKITEKISMLTGLLYVRF